MNLFELFAMITLDTSDYDKGLDEASEKTSSFGDKLKSGLGTAAKIGGAAISAAGAAIVALTKSSVSEYGEYEQLVGGVETLFKTSSDTVMGYAANAYKTAGMSANDYMTTVTSFSASLLQSLDNDTAAAAEKADLAITDMSDNANKMGTDMVSIQNAYQGFAKQNYTMLDNLKLGYGGTKEEMQRLIDDANALNAAQGNLTNYSIDSYADIVDAIHTVQTEMGITGTTALEASTTIQGSVSSMKSAWSNLVTGLADDDADMDLLIDNFVDSVATAGENLIPRIEKAIGGIATLISKASTTIVPLLITTLVNQLPSLINAGLTLVSAIGNGIIENLPVIAQTAIDVILQLTTALAEGLPELVPAIVSIITEIVQILLDNIPMLIDAALQIITGLAQGLLDAIPVLIEALPSIITALVNGLLGAIPQLIQAGITLLTSLVQALPEIITAIVEVIPEIITGIIDAVISNIPLIIQAGIDLFIALVQALPEIITGIVAAIPQIISSVIEAVIGAIPQLVEAGVQLFIALIENLPAIIIGIVEAVPQIVTGIVDAFSSLGSEIVDIGSNLLHGIWEGITGAAEWLWEKVTGWASGLIDGIKGIFGIHSPSTVFAGIGENLALGLGEGWDDEFANVKRDIEDSMDFGTGSIDFQSSAAGKSSSGIINGIMNVADSSEGGQYTINVNVDGTTIASIMFDPLKKLVRQRGEALA